KAMAKNLPRKALIAVSSFNGAIYPGGHKTGVFFVEALHPYEVLTAAGFEVDLASETGTCGFDEISLTPPFLSGSDHAILNNPEHPFMVKIKSQLKKASDLKGGLRILLRFRWPLHLVRLPEGESFTSTCCRYLGSRRHRGRRLPRPSHPAWHHRFQDRQIDHPRQDRDRIHDRRRTYLPNPRQVESGWSRSHR